MPVQIKMLVEFAMTCTLMKQLPSIRSDRAHQTEPWHRLAAVQCSLDCLASCPQAMLQCISLPCTDSTHSHLSWGHAAMNQVNMLHCSVFCCYVWLHDCFLVPAKAYWHQAAPRLSEQLPQTKFLDCITLIVRASLHRVSIHEENAAHCRVEYWG